MIRSLLYVPADNEKFLAKAHERGADAIILDLEDAVAEDRKDAARAALAEAVPSAGRNHASVFVRINSGPRQVDDAVAAARAGAFGVVIAKARDGGALESLAGTLRGVEAETRPPGHLLHRPDRGSRRRARRALDRKAPPRRRPDDRRRGSRHRDRRRADPGGPALPETAGPLRRQGRAASCRSASCARSPTTAISRASPPPPARPGRTASMAQPASIPRPSRCSTTAFSPSAADIAWAERVVAAAHGQTAGAFSLDGKMVDAPVIARALLMLERAKKAEG